MATENTTTRTSGTLSIGGRIATGILAGATAGSLVLAGGRILTDTTLHTAPSLLYGTGSYLSYRACRTGSGRTVVALDGCTVTTSGATAGSNTCVIANPYDGTDLPFSGTASIVRFQLDVISNPAAARVDIGPARSTTTSGSSIANSILIGSGASFVWTGSGSHPINNPLGLINGPESLVVPSGFLKVTAGSNPTSAYRATCKAWFTQNDAL